MRSRRLRQTPLARPRRISCSPPPTSRAKPLHPVSPAGRISLRRSLPSGLGGGDRRKERKTCSPKIASRKPATHARSSPPGNALVHQMFTVDDNNGLSKLLRGIHQSHYDASPASEACISL
ncbi:hypothetical protein GQ55_2G069300 [Panicum hallii var. hallii]|uniref:Uncharacterized protein n=1 Tax=Panicum hallii var. hallii TaxID=1504633 RepID=A0A2T7EM84_9POAL|nr:hypothetical protein GQ55_2G069300 [Panicum hallii var. hallii]